MISNRFKTILLLFIDCCICFTAVYLTCMARNANLAIHMKLFSVIFPFWLLIFSIEGLYSLKTYAPTGLITSLLRSFFLNITIAILLIYTLPNSFSPLTPKTNLLIISSISFILIYLWHRRFYKIFSSDLYNKKTVLLGPEESIKEIENELNKRPFLGYTLVSQSYPFPEGTEVIAIDRNYPNQAIVREVFNLIGKIEVIDLTLLSEKISGKIPLSSINENWFIEYCGLNESRSYFFLKETTDKLVALLLLIILFPLAIIAFPLLYLFHGKPLFFTQMRTGKNNKPFKLYKLRSMVVDAERNGAQWAKPKDARVTRIGSFLRKTRLDELPQLINILNGDMSLVGPRPERPEIIKSKLESEIPFYNLRHLVKPGVTGWAQVSFRYGFSKEDSKEKLQYDLYYVKNRSFWMDILILIKTIKTVISGAGQ